VILSNIMGWNQKMVKHVVASREELHSAEYSRTHANSSVMYECTFI